MPPSITTTSLGSGEVGVTYVQQLQASGGTAPYSWSTTTPLPDGLSLSSRGLLSGTPQASIEGDIVLSVTDGSGASASGELALEIALGPTISTTTIPTPVLGEPHATQLQALGGSPMSGR